MKTFTVSAALVLLSSFVNAAPTPSQAEARQFTVTVTFEGADPEAFFVQYIPTGGSVPIYNPLSISHISSDGGATCSFYGIDGSETVTVGAQTVDVGPPQQQVSAACSAF